MVTTRTAAHPWLRTLSVAMVLAATLGACAEDDPERIDVVDGAVQPGFDAGGFTGGAPAGGATAGATGGVVPGGPGAPGGATAGAPGGATGGVPGAAAGGGTTGGFIGGFIGGGFPGGFPGGRLDAGLPDPGVAVDAGAPGPGAGGDAGPDQFAELRQICVDTINMYRATEGLPPLVRANATQENCSDLGAQKDATGGGAHSSSGGNTTEACRRAGLGAQNTCPGWPGRPSLAESLKRCLAQMWAEGEPPIGVSACIADRGGCFQMYGHWINMTSAMSRAVSCGFYDMGNGSYWMNQDFAR